MKVKKQKEVKEENKKKWVPEKGEVKKEVKQKKDWNQNDQLGEKQKYVCEKQ